MRINIPARLTLVCFTIFGMVSNSRSQPEWVRHVISETTAFPVDASASEITLYNTKNVMINSQGHARIHFCKMTKIVRMPEKEAGMIAELKTPRREIKHLRGWHIPRSGEVQKLSDNDVAEVSVANIAGYYDESHTVIARFSDLAAGDVVAYEYDVEDEDWPATHQSYTFQVEQPVRFSSFSIEVPDGWNIHKSEWNLDSILFVQEGNRYTWTERNLPLRPEEPLMPEWSFLERQLNVTAYNTKDNKLQHFSDWQSVAQWVKSICDPSVIQNDTVKEEALKLTAHSASVFDKIRSIGNYVRDQIRYVAIEIGIGGWIPRNSSTTLYNKYGDCKDKVTLMRGMLQALNIPSSLVLANTSFYVHPDLPTPFQFNHAIIAIPVRVLDSLTGSPGAIAGKWLFFDPTDEINPFGALPPRLQGNRVLVASDGDSLLVRLPYSEPDANQRICNGTVLVGDNDSLSAQLRIIDRGVYSHYARFLHKNMSQDDQIKSMRKFYSSMFKDFILLDYSTGENEDSVWTSFRLQVKGGLRHSGNALLFKPNLFSVKEFPVLSDPRRQHPIWFGGPQRVNTDIFIEIPKDWTIEDKLPLKESACNDIAHLSYRITAERNKIHFFSQTDNNGKLIEVSDYENVRAFSRDMRSYTELTLMIHTK